MVNMVSSYNGHYLSFDRILLYTYGLNFLTQFDPIWWWSELSDSCHFLLYLQTIPSRKLLTHYDSIAQTADSLRFHRANCWLNTIPWRKLLTHYGSIAQTADSLRFHRANCWLSTIPSRKLLTHYDSIGQTADSLPFHRGNCWFTTILWNEEEIRPVSVFINLFRNAWDTHDRSALCLVQYYSLIIVHAYIYVYVFM